MIRIVGDKFDDEEPFRTLHGNINNRSVVKHLMKLLDLVMGKEEGDDRGRRMPRRGGGRERGCGGGGEGERSRRREGEKERERRRRREEEREQERTSNRRTGFGLTMKLKIEVSTVVRKGANKMRASDGSRVKKIVLARRRAEKS